LRLNEFKDFHIAVVEGSGNSYFMNSVIGFEVASPDASGEAMTATPRFSLNGGLLRFARNLLPKPHIASPDASGEAILSTPFPLNNRHRDPDASGEATFSANQALAL
jgi:hypothetical protein